MIRTQIFVVVLLLPTLISSLNEAQNPAQRTHRIERREVYHDGIKEDNNHLFRFAKLEGYGNLTIQVGSTAYLHCPVVNLGERPLSWVRRRDWHILSHGRSMFIQDDRFQLSPADHLSPLPSTMDSSKRMANADKTNNRSVRPKRLNGAVVSPAFTSSSRMSSGTSVRGSVSLKSGSFFGDGEDFQDWIMMIKHVQANDTGSYECQVTTDEGGILSHQVELKVETPEAFILADEEYHIDTGSSLSLVCIIEKATEPPAYVFWYHNDRMVNYDSERGISVSTTPGRRTHSQLSIKKAVVSDSGNYTCAPARSLPASIQVFVAGSEVKPWTSGGSSTFDYHGQLTTAITFNLAAILASALHCSILSISGYPAGT